MKLHGYFRSSAAYRVRIALNLKGLDYEQLSYRLLDNEQRSVAFLELNPQGLVPALETEQGVITQSLAIIEYLEESYPDPCLLPEKTLDRARVRSLALTVACDVHPLNNLRVLQYLESTLGVDADARKAWYRHWIELEFATLEKRLGSEPATGRFCHGDAPTLADACLVPQVFNARRFEVDMPVYPTIERIDAACQDLEAFRRAHPDRQPDAG